MSGQTILAPGLFDALQAAPGAVGSPSGSVKLKHFAYDPNDLGVGPGGASTTLQLAITPDAACDCLCICAQGTFTNPASMDLTVEINGTPLYLAADPTEIKTSRVIGASGWATLHWCGVAVSPAHFTAGAPTTILMRLTNNDGSGSTVTHRSLQVGESVCGTINIVPAAPPP